MSTEERASANDPADEGSAGQHLAKGLGSASINNYVSQVARDVSSGFAGYPLAGAAWAAKFNEQLRAGSSWQSIKDSIMKLQNATVPRLAIPSGFFESLSVAAAANIDVTRFQRQYMRSLAPLLSSLTSADDFRRPDPPRAAYSPSMTSPGAYFAADEVEIKSIGDLNNRITALVAKTPDLPLVWRGARNADWAIHSSLFRRLCEVNGVVEPAKRPRGAQPYPDENQMVRAETEILRIARTDWRFDGLSALETFARIQHAGGPTRLLDVTKNPYIAAWFAVEQHDETDGQDARLMAFATEPVSKAGEPRPASSRVELDSEWGARMPPWFSLRDTVERQAVDWGTGARRWLWVPPAYDPRIAAQNAAFILDGVPMTSSKVRSSLAKTPEGGRWTRADLLAAASIHVKTFKSDKEPRSNKANLAPTFTFRIASSVKREIREFLESRFGYTRSYVYPDITELARHLGTLPLAELNDTK